MLLVLPSDEQSIKMNRLTPILSVIGASAAVLERTGPPRIPCMESGSGRVMRDLMDFIAAPLSGHS